MSKVTKSDIAKVGGILLVRLSVTILFAWGWWRYLGAPVWAVILWSTVWLELAAVKDKIDLANSRLDLFRTVREILK